MLPYILLDEVEEGDDGQGSELSARGLAVEEEIEKFETYGVALCIESITRQDISKQMYVEREGLVR